MPGFERAATIDRPPQQVYAVLDDVRGCGRWMPAVRRIEVLTPSHAVDVGFRWRETRRVLGVFRLKMELEIVEHQPPRTWGLRYDDGKTRALATFTLERSAEGGTLITLREDVTALDGNERRVARMAKQVEKADDDALRRLKAYVETLPRLAEPDPVAEAKPRKSPKKSAKKPAKKSAKKAA